MSKTRRKPIPETQADTTFVHTETTPQVAEIVQAVADSTAMPESNGFAAKHAPGYIANPSSTRRESHAASVGRRLPASMSIQAGDLLVRLIDKGDNFAGIGIRVELPEGRTLTDDEKAIIRLHVKGEDGEKTGFSWNKDVGMWHKEIVRDGEHAEQIPSSRPVAIRLDAERRVNALAEDLRDHQADPVGFADRIKQDRENAASRDCIPD